jgi:hypothetical protein
MRALPILLAALFAFFALQNAVPEILLVVLIFTLGLALPLLFLNTVLLYLLAAWPVLLVWRATPRNWAAIGLAACVVPVVAFGSPFLSERLAHRKAERVLATDAAGTLAETPKSVEIVATGGARAAGSSGPTAHAPCEALCQRLLLGGDVARVRVSRTFGRSAARQHRQHDYTIERGGTCPEAFPAGIEMLPETKDALAAGTCFVPRESDATRMAARITVTEQSVGDPKDLSEDLAAASGTIRLVRTLEVAVATADGWAPRLRRTQVDYSHWAAPLYLTYATCYGMCMGRPVFGRTQRKLNAFDTVEVVLQALRLERARPAPLGTADRVIAMLDHAGEILTANQEQLITDWVTAARGFGPQKAAFTDKDAQLTLRLAQDRRVTNFLFVAEVIARNRNLLRDHLDLFLDEMEARGANSAFSNQVGAIIPRLDLTDVLPRRDRVLALIRTNDWKWSHGIGILAGRLGADTTALIAERLRVPQSAESAALAACLADEPVGRALVPHLMAWLHDRPVTDRFPDNGSRIAVKALARFGAFEAASELYLARFPKSGSHSLPRQSAAKVVTDPNACFWG